LISAAAFLTVTKSPATLPFPRLLLAFLLLFWTAKSDHIKKEGVDCVGYLYSGFAPIHSDHNVGYLYSGFSPIHSAHNVGYLYSGFAPIHFSDKKKCGIGIVGWNQWLAAAGSSSPAVSMMPAENHLTSDSL
jgi:hypothetical protein